MPQEPERQAEEGAPRHAIVEEQLGLARRQEEHEAGAGAAQDADVNERRAFQEDEEHEQHQPAAGAIALAELDRGTDRHGRRQAAGGDQVEAEQRLPRAGPLALGRQRGLLQRREDDESEEHALEEILGREPAHVGGHSASRSPGRAAGPTRVGTRNVW